MSAAITDKDIYKGKPNPFDDVTKGAEILLKVADQIIAKGKELSKITVGNINTNPKKTTSDLRAYQTEINKLTKTTKELTETEKQRKLLQDQLRQSEDQNIKAKLRYNDAVRTQRKEITQLIKWQKAEKASIDRLNAANAILRNRVRGVSAATEAGRKKIALYNKAIDRNTVKVKQLSDAQTRQLKNVGNYGSALKGVASSLGLFTSGALLAATAIRKFVSVTKEAIDVNREFEKTFANVLTLLDEAQKKEFGDILAVGAVDVMANYGLEIGDVNEALFDVISNGIEAGDAIDFLNKSAVLATAGNAELADVVKGATKVYTVYKDEVESVDEIMNAFFAAQVDGATDVNLLANNIGKVAGTAKKAGIPINELFGTFAGLTKALDGTEESATALVNIINSLIKASPQATKEFKKYGIETGITAIKQNGLLETILQVVKATEDNEDAIVKLIPNIRAFKGIATLTEDSIDDLKDTIEQLNDQEKSAALLQAALNEQMETGQKQADTLKGSYQRMLIVIGGGESIFKKIGTSIRSELKGAFDDVSFAMETFRFNWGQSMEFIELTWSRMTKEISKDEFRDAVKKNAEDTAQGLLDIAERYGKIKKAVDDTSEALEGNEAITKNQMALIIKYNTELEKQLKFTKENYEIVKKYYDEIPPEQEKELVTINSLNDQVKALEKERKDIDVNDTKRLAQLRYKIDLLKEEIKTLEDLGKAPKLPKEALGIQIDEPEIVDDLDLDQGLSDEIDREIDEIKAKLDIIDKLYAEHYDSLIGLGFNYANRKAAQDQELSSTELQAIIDSNNQKEQAVQQLADTLISIYNQLLASRLAQIDADISAKNQEINELEQAVNREHQLLIAGAANEYNTEKEKLKKIQAERDKDIQRRKETQKQQETINTLMQISELATAVATIIASATSELGWAGVVAGLAAAAAAIVGFATYKDEATSAANAEDGGMFTKKGAHIEGGKRHSKGGNKYSSAEFEQGEAHSIFSRKATNKYSDIIEDFTNAANDGKLNSDELEMYRFSIATLSPTNIFQSNNIELLRELRNVNKNLMSQKTPIYNPKGNFELYDRYGLAKVKRR